MGVCAGERGCQLGGDALFECEHFYMERTHAKASTAVERESDARGAAPRGAAFSSPRPGSPHLSSVQLAAPAFHVAAVDEGQIGVDDEFRPGSSAATVSHIRAENLQPQARTVIFAAGFFPARTFKGLALNRRILFPGQSAFILRTHENMTSAYQSCRAFRSIALIACWLVGACHVANDNPTVASAGSSAAAGAEERGGSGSDGGKHAGGAGGGSPAGHPAVGSGEAGQAGGGNEAGDTESAAAGSGDAGASNVPAGTAPTECDVDGGCASNCTGETVSCGVESFGDYCEFELFHDTPVTVTCGQTATVGIANCGGCGTIAVEVYYDGSLCWQGIPDCTLPGFFGKVLNPHAPLP